MWSLESVVVESAKKNLGPFWVFKKPQQLTPNPAHCHSFNIFTALAAKTILLADSRRCDDNSKKIYNRCEKGVNDTN